MHTLTKHSAVAQEETNSVPREMTLIACNCLDCASVVQPETDLESKTYKGKSRRCSDLEALIRLH